MQVAVARRGFAPLRYWDGPGREKTPCPRNPQAAKNRRTTRDFFHASEHTVRHNRRTKTHRRGACAPFGAGALRRPLPSEGRRSAPRASFGVVENS